MKKSIDVSCLCITYNQKDTLRQTLDSMVGQQTDFKIEILVHDDCSTDGTTDILHEYKNKYPNLIVPIYEEKNQYHSGRSIVREMVKYIAKGKYIAICEGDDYWLDPLKLQKQYEALEANPNVDLCAGRGIVVEAKTGNRIGWMRPKNHDCIIPVSDVIAGGGQYFASASLFFRRSILSDMTYEFEKELDIDYAWQIKGSLRGGAYYIDSETAAYRSGVDGAWSTRMKRDERMRTEHFRRIVRMLEVLDRETSFKYHEAISKRIEMGKGGSITFFDQLEMKKDEIMDSLKQSANIFLWGNGVRGRAFQEFCKKYGVDLKGVCDAVDESIGESTALGFAIVSTDAVKKSDGIIIASNQIVYDELKKIKISAKIINLQQYIKYE